MGRLLVKGLLFAASLAALLSACEALLTSLTPWRRYEDPRARILWDGGFDGSPVVLIGSSEFASLYVDSLTDTLSSRLAAYTGRGVFPGALNGARPPDVLAAALHVSREWPSGTTVFVGLPPTLFIASRAEEPARGNYADIYFRRYGIDASNRGAFRSLRGWTNRRILRPFFAERTRGALAHLVDRPGPSGWLRHRSWLDEPDTPRERFEFLEQNLTMDVRRHLFDWIREVQHPLEAAGLRPIFVLTPLNEDLIHRFARVHSAEAILLHFHETRRMVTAHLAASRSTFVDLTNSVPAECFFDIQHVNTCGDDLMAQRFAAWLDGDLDLEARSR